MILKTRCPSCGAIYRLQEPLPPEGKKYRCTCKTIITLFYPEEVKERLRAREMELQAEDGDTLEEGPPTQPVSPPPTAVSEPREKALQDRNSEAQTASGRLTPPPKIPPMQRRPSPGSSSSSAESSSAFAPLYQGAPGQQTPDGEEATEIETKGPSRTEGHQASPAAEAPPDLFTPPDEDVSAPDDEDGTDTVTAPIPRRPVGGSARKTGAQGGAMARWLRRLAIAAAIAGLAGVGTVAGVYAWFAYFQSNGEEGEGHRRGVASVDSLAVYEPRTVTTVRDPSGQVIGEFYEEQRYVVPLEQVPEVVRNAFVAAEDAAFWDHKGLDYLGIVRAMITNIREGRMSQGASTITQQVARSFLLTREKKLARKIKEAILASRIETNFDKNHILYLYLNQIYLGHGAYGVQAAAQLYFGKDVSQLGLAEAAIIAGLPQAPANYSPNRNFRAAKVRQKYVLGQMAKREYITQEQAEAAAQQELTFVRKRNRNLDIAPFYVEHVRRHLIKTYGHDATYNQGLQVTIPIDVSLQKVANESVSQGVRFTDKRVGYRGPIERHGDELSARQKALEAIDKERAVELRPYDPAFDLPEGPLARDLVPAFQKDEITRGVVAEVGRTWAIVDVGSLRGLLPVSEFTWCHNIKPDVDFRYFKCRRLDDMVKVGDLIAVRVVEAEPEDWSRTLPRKHDSTKKFVRLAMEQAPGPEGALMSLRVADGAVLSMVGGSSFEGSEFNRAIQAKRQVGSTFKPLVYAAALDHEKKPHTPSTILVDAPIVEELTGKEGELWKPGNSGGEYLGDTTFRRGLILSRNIVTLKVLRAIGVSYTLDYMKRFGFETKLEENLAMGLGASALTIHELLRAYTVFATLGDRRDPFFISEVRDRHGTVLEQALEGELTPDVMSEETAYVMVDLMRSVVKSGTARRALELGHEVAGKTGTTNAFRDAWFVGYTPEILTTAWVGFDDFRPLGKGQYGGEIALPIWMRYMKAALEKYPPSEYKKPKDIVVADIDSRTGLLAREGEPAVKVVYKKDTEPKTYAPSANQVDAADFLSGEY